MAMILTLGFDEESFERFDALRQAHFPPERNFIPAHLTLFQQLPDAEHPMIARLLQGAAGINAPLPFSTTGILDFGKGCAIALDMPGYTPLLGYLRARMAFPLAAQDRQKRKPHVTVQNKVRREVATATIDQMRAGFAPWHGKADRFLLWHYRGGPWDLAADVPLTGPVTSEDR